MQHVSKLLSSGTSSWSSAACVRWDPVAGSERARCHGKVLAASTSKNANRRSSLRSRVLRRMGPHCSMGPAVTSAPSTSVPQGERSTSPSEKQYSLAYEIVQGALVRWSDSGARSGPAPPTAVLLHGILGGRRNWASFAKRLAQEFPTWQFLLVDLRCHGDSAAVSKRAPHSVPAAASDVLRLMGQLGLTPRVLIGHSFGGKVALSMVDQAAKPLARPIRVWVLDATPGLVRRGAQVEDSPPELIAALREMPEEVPSRRWVIQQLQAKGFSNAVAQWMTTNLRQVTAGEGGSGSGGLRWVFDIDGIDSMYSSYEETSFWHLVEDVPEGVHIDFLRAERSLHRWAREEVARLAAAEAVAAEGAASIQLHVLSDAGHWVHADNPDGLFQILMPTFGPYRFVHSNAKPTS